MTAATEMRESRLRSILKAASYRVVGSITTALLAYFVTGDWKVSLSIGAIEPLVKTIIYYLHERAWQQVPRGRVRRLIRQSE